VKGGVGSAIVADTSTSAIRQLSKIVFLLNLTSAVKRGEGPHTQENYGEAREYAELTVQGAYQMKQYQYKRLVKKWNAYRLSIPKDTTPTS
jgi:hypothetical protein